MRFDPCSLLNYLTPSPFFRTIQHELSSKLGLVSKSSGKGDARRITIRKVVEKKRIAAADGEEESFPMLRIGTRGIHELHKYVTAHPPNDIERMESYETGSSLLLALTKQQQKQQEIDDNVLWSMSTDAVSKQQSDDLLQTLESFHVTTTTTTKPREVASQGIREHSAIPTTNINQRKQWHKIAQENRSRHPKNASMTAQRRALPASNYASQICDAIHSNSVVIISGDTGCGKSKIFVVF